ncbi:MAG: Asp23/Gls24 family envelope stress response protein [Clostridiales bacterium]|nr:Asp23/Gls24 family envelope stress response protein [Candidatus Cacconaster stercorequi]
MADNKEYMTHQENMGTIQISEDVVASIATSAALEVEGVSGLLNANMTDFMGGKKMTARGVRVEMDDAGMLVNLFLTVRYGNPVAEVADKVQKAVFGAMEGMTGFQVSAVNVHVGGISFE